MNARSILLFGASVAASAILTTAASSDAAWVRSVGVSHCARSNSSLDSLAMSSKGIFNTDLSASVTVLCDVPSDTTYTPGYATAVDVEGYDNSATQAMSFFLCRRYLSGGGGACGNASSNGAVSDTGSVMVNLDVSVWANSSTSTFPYLVAVLPSMAGGSNSFTGFRVSYP